MFTTEEKTRARQANLIEYFENKRYKVEKTKDENIYKVRGFGGLYIKNETCYYCFSKERGGNAIECLMDVLHLDFKTAMNELLNYSSVIPNRSHHEEKSKKKYMFEMPELNKDQHRAFAYLTKVRGINADLIAKLVKSGLLFQTKEYGNIVFPYMNFDNKIVGAELVGTTQNKRFKKIDKNSDALTSYWIKIGEPKKLFVFESPIDLLSFLCLKERNKELLENSIFLSMSGLKYSVVNEFLIHFKPEQLYICVDNPEMSNEKDTVSIENFMNHFPDPDGEKIIRLIPNKKDWNDDLLSLQTGSTKEIS